MLLFEYLSILDWIIWAHRNYWFTTYVGEWLDYMDITGYIVDLGLNWITKSSI